MILNKHTRTGYTIPITISPSVLGNHAELYVHSATFKNSLSIKRWLQDFAHIDTVGWASGRASSL